MSAVALVSSGKIEEFAVFEVEKGGIGTISAVIENFVLRESQNCIFVLNSNSFPSNKAFEFYGSHNWILNYFVLRRFSFFLIQRMSSKYKKKCNKLH